ncbi:hypothetical protein [Bradyrhizobium sp. BR 10289]|uniref:hypothetical protein n=1 Tax=Bradyrhizobium sp. BR 10289 TaxID=2749993 RepID=UPI001C64A848|nr:hypothetical protein [Bradyrhizobium sp. BR 10289]MBW7973551.1 hypothetical protein [Bradyrhizobium sp. BR 10289]
MRHDTNELKDKVFRTADVIALEKGVAAVGIDGVHRQTGGGRQRVSKYVKAWKMRQQARAAEMPDRLRLMARRLAEEAWILALIARGDAKPETSTAASEVTKSARRPAAARPPETGRLVEDVPRSPRKAAGDPSKLLKPVVWTGAENPKFAEVTARALVRAGYPLYSRDLESGEYPPSTLDRYAPGKPGRAISRALRGSRIQTEKDGSLWFEGVPRPARPKRKSIYKRVDTDLSRRRELSPVLVSKAVAFIANCYPASVHFTRIWDHVDPPDGFTESWLRHALRDRAKQAEAEFKMLGEGRYIASATPKSVRRGKGEG